MRKSWVGIMALLAGIAVPGMAEAQARPFTIGIGGGPSFPTGHFAEEANTGFHLQGSLGFTPALLPVGVRADLIFQQFSDEHSGNFREYGGLVNGTLGLPLGVLRPYAIAGAGLINHNPPSEEHGDHAHEGEGGTEFAWNVGGGIRFGLGGLNAFAEARLLNAGAGHRAVPITIGVTF